MLAGNLEDEMGKCAVNELKSKCCGCMACVNICPVHALKVTVNNGFSVPIVDNAQCINCGLCADSCPVIQADVLKSESKPLKVLLAKNKNITERKRSTSGGIFFPIAEMVISWGGCCYGAAYSKEWKISHSVAFEINECIRFQGSKYVQSDIQECYGDIQEKLVGGKMVLFTGTPCQVAAIKSFCSKKKIDMKNLLTVEILCYGVPSPQIWMDHINHLESKYGKLKEYSFRDERNGWGNLYYHCARFQDGKELYQDKELQAFGSLFGSHVNMRESCFSCEFDSMHRCADITIGDCWGIENINKEFYDSNGVSQVLVNTEKGLTFWNSICNRFDTAEVDLEKLAQYNSVLSYSAERPDDYDKFWSDYNELGFDYIMKRYTRMGKTYRVRKKMRNIFKEILTNIKHLR